MKVNDNTLIYIYDPSDEAQEIALASLQKLQHYQLVKIGIDSDLSAVNLDTLEKALENSDAFSDSPQEFTRTLKEEPDQVKTPVVITWRRSMYLEGDQPESFSDQLSWLNNPEMD